MCLASVRESDSRSRIPESDSPPDESHERQSLIKEGSFLLGFLQGLE